VNSQQRGEKGKKQKQKKNKNKNKKTPKQHQGVKRFTVPLSNWTPFRNGPLSIPAKFFGFGWARHFRQFTARRSA
jgi:hypothetical protein